MSELQFSEKAWEDYLYWQSQDKKTVRKINALIRDIQRGSFEGAGKPEPLKGELSGYWSRRIDSFNRIVYRQAGGVVFILSCLGHYK